jgi:hypothetical protein
MSDALWTDQDPGLTFWETRRGGAIVPTVQVIGPANGHRLEPLAGGRMPAVLVDSSGNPLGTVARPLEVNATLSVEGPMSNVKVTTDGGITWVGLKGDAEGRPVVSLPGSVAYTNIGPETIAGGASYSTNRISTAGAGSLVLNYMHGRGDTDTKMTLRWYRNLVDSEYVFEQDDVLAEESIYGGGSALPVVAAYVEIIVSNLGVEQDAFYLQYGLSPLPIPDTTNLRRLATDLAAALTILNRDRRGLAAGRPLADAVPVGTTYWSVDTDPSGEAIEVSNGVSWVVT